MATVTEILSTHLENIKAKVQARLSSEGRQASGRTAASLEVSVSGSTGILMGSSALLSIERGRGPGAVPKNFTSVIKDWIIAKGISVKPVMATRAAKLTPEERGLNSLAGAIAHTIMTKGTRLHRDKGFNDIYSSVLEEEIESLGKEISIDIAEKITTINARLQ